MFRAWNRIATTISMLTFRATICANCGWQKIPLQLRTPSLYSCEQYWQRYSACECARSAHTAAAKMFAEATQTDGRYCRSRRCHVWRCRSSKILRHSPLPFFLFVQRLHQYASMQEIADALRTKLVQPWELKHFVSNICCEKYADPEAHQKNVQYLEENFPTYSEKLSATNNANGDS